MGGTVTPALKACGLRTVGGAEHGQQQQPRPQQATSSLFAEGDQALLADCAWHMLICRSIVAIAELEKLRFHADSLSLQVPQTSAETV